MNSSKVVAWFWIAVLAGFFGFIAGCLAGAGIGASEPALIIWTGFLGACILAALPSLVMIWFLFLVMIGQTSEAIRDNQKNKNRYS